MRKFKCLKIIIIVLILCCFLQIIAFCIPSTLIEHNIMESASLLNGGGLVTLAPDYYTFRIDTFTDSWMINIAGYSREKSILEKAFGAFYYDFSNLPAPNGSGPFLALTELVNGHEDLLREGSYARYWHGYIFFLRLALMMLNYSDIRMLNFIILFLLMTYLFSLIKQSGKKIFPFAITLLAMCPLSMFFCMAYSGVTYITLISSILLIRYRWWKMDKLMLYTAFMIIGMLTNWLDILSFPLISLGIPLVFLVCYTEKAMSKNILKTILLVSLAWGMGYAGMWIFKWIISSVVLKRNVVEDALGAAAVRASNYIVGTGEKISLLDVVIGTLQIMYKKPYVFLAGISLVYTLRELIIHNKCLIANKEKLIALLVISVYPVLWCSLFTEHTLEHSLFTFRIWGVTVFGILSILNMYSDTEHSGL